MYISRRLCLVVLCFTLPLTCWSQQQQVDSLLSVLKTYQKQDTTKANLLANLALNYQYSNADSMSIFAQQGLTLSEKLQYRQGIAKNLMLLGIAADIKGDYSKCLPYYTRALRVYKEMKDPKGESRILNAIAGFYYHTTNYPLALQYWTSALKINEQTDDKKGMGSTYINMGNVYAELGEYASAIENYFKGLKAFEAINDQVNKSTALSNIAAMYNDLGKYDDALKYNSQSLKINEAIGNKRGIIQNLVNIGIVRTAQNNYRDALDNYLKAEVLAVSTGDHYWSYLCRENIALAYLHLNQPDKAMEYYQACLSAAEASGEVSGVISGKAGIAGILLTKKQTSEAIALLLEADKLAREANIIPKIVQVSGLLAEAYEAAGNKTKAVEYYKITSSYKDSLDNDGISQQLLRMQFDHEMGEKEIQISSLQRDKVIAHKSFEEQKVTVAALTAGLVLVLVLATILYNNRRKLRQSSNELLSQKEAIRLQATKLKEMNQFKDKVISILSHDLRSPINALQGIIPLLEAGVVTQEDFNVIKKETESQITAIHTLIDNLVEWSKGNMETAHSQYEIISIYEIAEQNISLLKTSAARKNIDISSDVPVETIAQGRRNEIDFICRNLIANAIKFTNIGGSIYVSAIGKGEFIELSVKDTGIGMTQDQIAKLESDQVKQGSYGTSGEKGSGLGLLLCKEFIKKHKGTLRVDSEVGKGSQFIVTLPIHQETTEAPVRTTPVAN